MHKLQKQILNINYYDERGVDAFYNRAMDLFYQELRPEMERILDKHGGDGDLVKINNLTLDFGTTYETDLRSQWLTKFSEEFENKLLARLERIRNGLGAPGESIHTLSADELEMLVYYLQKGSLPWNAGSSNISIHALFERLLQSMPAEVDKRLRSETSNEKMIRRIVLQFSDRQIENLVRVMQPSESEFIIRSSWEIRKAQQRDHFIETGDREFRDAIWNFILTYIINDRGSYFDTREFLRYLLHGIASHFNISSRLLIREIFKSMSGLKLEPVKYRLGILLEDIYRMESREKPGSIIKDISYRQIIDFLLKGKTEKIHEADHKKYYSGLVTAWINEAPLEISLFLYQKGDEISLQRLVSVLSETGIKKLVRTIAPADATFIIHFNEDIVRQQQEFHFVKTNTRQFRSDLWIVLLGVILNSKGSVFNQKMFVLSSLEKLSKHYNLDTGYFIDLILSLVEQQNQIIVSSFLYDLFLEIKHEFALKRAKKSSAKKTGDEEYFEYLDLLTTNDLTSGQKTILRLPFQSPSVKKEITRHLLRQKPVQFRIWLKKSLNTESKAAGFFEDLEEKEMSALFSLLAGNAGKRLGIFINILIGVIKAHFRKNIILSVDEIYRIALIFIVLSKQNRISEKELYSFLIRKVAGSVRIDEDLLAGIILKEAGQRPGAGPKGISKEVQGLVKAEPVEPDKYPTQKLSVKDHRVEKAEEELRKELEGIQSAKELEQWLVNKLSLIKKSDLKRLRLVLSAFYLKQKEKKRKASPVPEENIDKILSALYEYEIPYLRDLMDDLKLIFKKMPGQLGTIDIIVIKSRILYFWSTTINFSEKRLISLLLDEMGVITGKPGADIKELLFKQALAVQKQLKSRLILELGADESVPEEASPEPEAGATEPENQVKFTEDEVTDESGTIYISNAGLVLLGPFIPSLFERAGLLKNRSFDNDGAVEHAIFLLQYCVNSGDDNSEHLLSLPKILCGIDPAEPIRDNIALTKDDKELVSSLLENVISQWKIIGNTSVEGLQQTFLQRNGALRKKDERWELEVEKGPFDMLLDKIPWTYSMIKYPWMTKPVYTLWR